MAFGFFFGDAIKILRNKLNLNGDAILDGSAISANSFVTVDASKNIKSSADFSVSAGKFLSASAIQTRQTFDLLNGANYISLDAPNTLAVNVTYTFPDTAPSANSLVLSTNTGGQLAWIAQSGGSSVAGDVAPTTFAVSASQTNSVFTASSTYGSYELIWSLRDVALGAYQSGRSTVLNKNTDWEIATALAGTANWGGVNLTVTTAGVVQLVNPAASGTFNYRALRS